MGRALEDANQTFENSDTVGGALLVGHVFAGQRERAQSEDDVLHEVGDLVEVVEA